MNKILVKGLERKLNKLIDYQYRTMKGLSKSERLDGIKGGLFENKIKYSNNYFLSNAGITFIHNEYEIAPYSTGRIFINIPYQLISELIRQEYKSILGI